MRIVTYNIRGCLGIDGVRSPKRIADVIRGTGAQVVCLQEVHQRLPESGFQDQPHRLGRLLGMRCVFQCNFRLGVGRYGNAILTALQVLSRHSTELPNACERARILKLPERRGLLEVVLDTPAGPLTVMTTHWSLDAQDRLDSAPVVAERLRRAQGPVILCGDFNATPDSEEIRLLAEVTGLQDAGAPGNEPTFPADVPSARIDYVWLSEGLDTAKAETISTDASDHLPVVAAWPGE